MVVGVFEHIGIRSGNKDGLSIILTVHDVSTIEVKALEGAVVAICDGFATVTESDVIKVEDEFVSAVEVTDGHPDLLTSVSAEVGGVLIPSTLGSVTTNSSLSIIRSNILGSQRPFLD